MADSQRSLWRRKLARARAFLRWYCVSVHTRSGRVFDIVMIGVIFVGVAALIMESVPDFKAAWHAEMQVVEAVVGTVFVVEYLIRIWVARQKLRYMRSFWGVIDLLAIAPFFFQGFGFAYLRALRVLRVFTILKIAKYTQASRILIESLAASRSKIAVFLLAVFVLVILLAFLIHGIEPQTFPTVPDAMWWVVVTITTVGYGDLVPVTLPGKILAAGTMVTAFGIIAVPTGIVASEYGIARNARRVVPCFRCGRDSHDSDAEFCAGCGNKL